MFQNPVTPPKSWEGVRDCTTPSSPCLYVLENGEIFGDEDCLYLNLYTPEVSFMMNTKNVKENSEL